MGDDRAPDSGDHGCNGYRELRDDGPMCMAVDNEITQASERTDSNGWERRVGSMWDRGGRDDAERKSPVQDDTMAPATADTMAQARRCTGPGVTIQCGMMRGRSDALAQAFSRNVAGCRGSAVRLELDKRAEERNCA